MSEDIVDRLRNPRIDACVKQEMDEAADEIERLRTTIAQLRSVAGAVSLDVVTFDQIKAGSGIPVETGGRPIGEVVDTWGFPLKKDAR